MYNLLSDTNFYTCVKFVCQHLKVCRHYDTWKVKYFIFYFGITGYLVFLELVRYSVCIISREKRKDKAISVTAELHSHSTTQYNSGSFILYFTDDNSSVSAMFSTNVSLYTLR